MTDLTAARERHVKGAMPALCHHDPLNYPCDAARFRDALDKAEAEWDRAAEAVESAAAERLDAARALADELAEALENTIDHAEHYECDFVWCEQARAALAKWEASK